MTSILEMTMLICFGISWPMNIIKSLQTKSAKGKSLPFLCFILVGYIAGILAKLTQPINYVLFFYVLNFVMVFIDFLLYWRNKGLDKKRMEQNI